MAGDAKMSEDCYYVYLLRRPWNNVPCYVGKGKGRRYTHHAQMGENHYNAHLANIFRKAGDASVPVEFVATGLSCVDALALEVKLIAEIGRESLGAGPLCNQTDGGDGVSGCQNTRGLRL
jgi:hypothetical protein